MDDDLTAEIRAARAAAHDDARPAAVAAAHERGRLTARERVAATLDPGSFEEYGALAEGAPDQPGRAPADGVVSGAGTIGGRPVVIAAYDVSVVAGTQSGRNHRKIERLLFLAQEHRWPFICFLEGEGGRPEDLPGFDGGVPGVGARFGTFEGLAELSGWAPTVAVVSGTALLGHMSIAMLCDVVIGTHGSEIGGALPEDPRRPIERFEQSGDIDLVVADDLAAAAAVRRTLALALIDLPDGEPSAAADGIDAIVPDDRRRAYDMRKVIEAVADAGTVLELRPNSTKAMLTTLARMGGRGVGIFANQPLSPQAGAIDPDSADKLARFIELCDAYELPLVAFIDNPGYLVGPRSERAGIARHHTRPLSALHHRSVPLYSVQLRKAYGLGPFAMSGFGNSRLSPDLRLAWPSVESGGMSLEGAAYLVRRREIRAAANRAEEIAIRDEYANSMRDLTSGLRAGRTYAFDDIVEPRDTRDRIIAMLRMTERRRPAAKKHYIDSI